MSGIVNKIKDAVHSDKHTGHHAPEGTHGPHNSRVANAADPRVDSDRDGSRNMGASTGRTAGHGEFGSNPFSSGNTTGAGTFGTYGTSEGGAGSGMTGMTDTYGTSEYGAGSGMTGMTGTHGAPAGTHGPHSNRMANIADPRVDSDRDGRGAIGSGPGPAHDTAGPHASDMMNKADPRVDSDLDGSKTLGGNKTFNQSGLAGSRDPTDAAQVPPSVLQKTVGGVQIAHDDHSHQRERRNSIKTHQETFRGV